METTCARKERPVNSLQKTSRFLISMHLGAWKAKLYSSYKTPNGMPVPVPAEVFIVDLYSVNYTFSIA
jgi:hypothetical protein